MRQYRFGGTAMLVAGVYLLTGLLWTGSSWLLVAAHPEYWDPRTMVDWIAVWLYSLAFAFTAISVPLLARDARAGRGATIIAAATGASAGLTAVGNALEDAFNVGVASTMYVIGVLGTLIGLVVLALALWARGRPRSATVAVLVALGLATSTLGLGVLVLVGMLLAGRDHLAAGSREALKGGAHA